MVSMDHTKTIARQTFMDMKFKKKYTVYSEKTPEAKR